MPNFIIDFVASVYMKGYLYRLDQGMIINYIAYAKILDKKYSYEKGENVWI